MKKNHKKGFKNYKKIKNITKKWLTLDSRDSTLTKKSS